MKRLFSVLALATVLAETASAADMTPRAYSKAPPPPVALVSWTGCYVGAGGGYGMLNQENTVYDERQMLAGTGPRTLIVDTTTTGGRGSFGMVQGGCDYQFSAGNQQFVVGAFGDYDFSNLKGRLGTLELALVGDERMSSAWAAGGRVGWLATPSLLTYLIGGYTEAKFDRVNFNNSFRPLNTSAGMYIDGRTYKGWFLGAGDEYALSFLPGLFWKTEYRFSEFNTETNPIRITASGLPFGDSVDSKRWVHTVRSELVYRFHVGN